MANAFSGLKSGEAAPPAEKRRPSASASYPSLKGKRVVVTGGASGIGASLVAAFAAQGAETIFVDILERESADLVAELSGAAAAPAFHRVDLRDLGAVEAFFRKIGPV